MVSFRSSKTQAAHLIEQKLALNTPRHGNQKDGLIHGQATANRYAQALKNVSDWLKSNNILNGLTNITLDQAQAYLDERTEQIMQKTLNTERRALETVLNAKIPAVRSLISSTNKHKGYEPNQVHLIMTRMKEHNTLATQIAQASGVRAHELLTLRESHEREASTHREWSKERFAGRENQCVYTVKGKGGLIREVSIPEHLHHQLQLVRLEEPKIMIDRGIKYESFYTIGGGQAWSKSFSTLSKKELGWSDGAHALRHNYARARMEELQSRGYNYYYARKIISQEMGHFRGEITEVYLR